ncbi:MAG TPA: hypothetical protein VFH31_11865 [Pyrinomonadaceae bacterium]|nr:hypothetical protein [Pyrinomonadaceae bacterium]
MPKVGPGNFVAALRRKVLVDAGNKGANKDNLENLELRDSLDVRQAPWGSKQHNGLELSRARSASASAIG